MQDGANDRGYGFVAALLIIAFCICVGAALRTGQHFLAQRHRLQANVVAPAATPAPMSHFSPSNEASKIVVEAPTETNPAPIPAAPELRQSIDLPQESSHADEEPAPAADAGRAVDAPATEVSPFTAGHDHRHARRWVHLLRRRRTHHRATKPGSCEPLCGFFKDTAEAAGLIQ